MHKYNKKSPVRASHAAETKFISALTHQNCDPAPSTTVWQPKIRPEKSLAKARE